MSASRLADSNLRYRNLPRASQASEQLQQKRQLLAGVPGQVVVLRVTDGQLGILVTEIRQVDHLDRGPDGRLRRRVVEVRGDDVADADRPANLTTASSRSGRIVAPSTSATNTACRSGSPLSAWPLGRQQSQGRQRSLPQRDFREFVVVAFCVGLPQRRSDGERRPAQGVHGLIGDEALKHGQGRRNVDTHQGRLAVYSLSPINVATWSGT